MNTSSSARAVLGACLLAAGSVVNASTIYGIGASWTSNGPDPVGTIGGDSRHSDGSVWLEIAATDPRVGAPLPISSSQTPSSPAETATNFARGGANISAPSGIGGVDRPFDSSEQVANLNAYLTNKGITPDDTDILAFSAGGMAANDLLDQFETDPSVINGAFITTLVGETEVSLGAAVGLGFSTAVILNMPDLTLLPGMLELALPPSELQRLNDAIIGYNSGLASSIAALQAVYTATEFILVDVYTLIGDVAANPGAYGFTDWTTALYTADGAAPTGADPATTAWWDPFHPSSALQAYIADAAFEAGSGSSAVPLPPVIWLFGAGLIGLTGLARRKAA